jgi:reductive dehalogenase
MIHLANGMVLFLGYCLLGVLLLMAVLFLLEGEKKAGLRSLILIPIPLLMIWLPQSTWSYNYYLTIPLVFLLVIFLIYLCWPARFFSLAAEAVPNAKIDERTIMFSRRELQPGSERFNQYYNDYPEHRQSDDAFRELPGLLSKQSSFYHPLAYTAAEASFSIVETLQDQVEGEVLAPITGINAADLTPFVKRWLLKMGAVSAGIAEMKAYHWYEQGGRGDRYGEPIAARHKFGIAFTVEMDEEMVGAAPRSSIIMESAQQYLKSGSIAVQLAQFIRQLGYDARAHIDGNYQVVCPLVARDANLGEIGRMGLLMTPQLGPRVRIAVVTTDAPLVAVEREHDPTMEHFCAGCKKCADVCPSVAISDKPAETMNGVKRWQINSEKCFSYWCSAGTDCGRCMSVCPYSHPDTTMHNGVRLVLRNFPNTHWWAVKLDDYFYGRKPTPKKLPGWFGR